MFTNTPTKVTAGPISLLNRVQYKHQAEGTHGLRQNDLSSPAYKKWRRRDQGESLFPSDIREAFVRRWAKRTKRDEAKIKPEKSIQMYETEMRAYFRSVVAEMRGQETTLIEAEQQNKTEDLKQPTSDAQAYKGEVTQATSEAKPKDIKVDKDLTSETNTNENQTTTSETKPTDKQVDKDLTSEAVPKENVTKSDRKGR